MKYTTGCFKKPIFDYFQVILKIENYEVDNQDCFQDEAVCHGFPFRDFVEQFLPITLSSAWRYMEDND